MANSKRAAGRELNHDNWNDEEENEEAGEFKKASDNELKNRVRKVAKRRIGGGDSENNAPSNPFGGFGGFKASGFAASTPAAANSSPFSFLAKIPSATAPPPKPVSNGISTTSSSEKSGAQTEYLSKVKALNIAVSEWIKTHVDENPLCILTPIFKDYENYIKSFEDLKKKPQTTSSESEKSDAKPKDSSPITPSSIPTFSFGKPPAPATSPIASTSITPSFGSFKFGAAAETPAAKTSSPPAAISTSTAPEPAKSTFSFGIPTGGGLGSKPSTGSSVSLPATSTFSFGLSSTSAPPSIFGSSSTAFTGFGGVTQTASTEKPAEEEADEEPPKNEFVPVVEDDSLYSKRCKVFVKGASDFADRGVGTLYIKKVEDKIQLLVRADTNLGNILLNIMLVEGLPTSRMGKNNVMIVCVPTPDAKPPPTSVLVRVKTGEEADALLEQINKHKK